MRRLKRYIRKNTTLAEIIILLVGVIAIFIGFFSKITIISGIGTSMISSAIIVFMTEVMLGTDSNEIMHEWGLEEVHRTRGAMNKSCDVYINKARSLDIIAFGLKSFRDTQQKSVERILKKGGKIRIITMKPGCVNLQMRERDEFQPEGSIEYSIKQLIDWAKKINAKNYKAKIEVRFHEKQPLDFLFLMDNRLFTGPYEYGKNSQQTISFEYNNSGSAYEYYRTQFNDLWNDENFCEDALKE